MRYVGGKSASVPVPVRPLMLREAAGMALVMTSRPYRWISQPPDPLSCGRAAPRSFRSGIRLGARLAREAFAVRVLGNVVVASAESAQANEFGHAAVLGRRTTGKPFRL